jgi:hypothetical protein
MEKLHNEEINLIIWNVHQTLQTDHMKKDETGGICSTHGGDETYTHDVGKFHDN